MHRHAHMHTHVHICTHMHMYMTMVGLEPALGVRAGTPRGIHLWGRAGAQRPGQNGDPRPDVKTAGLINGPLLRGPRMLRL